MKTPPSADLQCAADVLANLNPSHIDFECLQVVSKWLAHKAAAKQAGEARAKSARFTTARRAGMTTGELIAMQTAPSPHSARTYSSHPYV